MRAPGSTGRCGKPGSLEAPPPPPLHRITVDEYERIIASGAVEDLRRVKLIDVYMVERMGKKAGHHRTTKEVLKALDDRLSPGWASQKEEPTRIPADDEMEPDIANIRGQEGRSNA
jgi:hypothetical protein